MTASHRRLRIALDAMGGDYGPSVTVPGAAAAVRSANVDVLLVGEEDQVKAELAKIPEQDRAHLLPVPSQGVVKEGDSPVQSLRQMPQSSIAVCGGLVKAGKADAFVSMGSTGATVAVGMFALGGLEGMERPAIGGPLLSFSPNMILVDIGSNVDTRPSQMVQFGALGTAFASTILGVANPRVALLNVGSEEGKGNRQTKEAYALFKGSGLNFVGNVEGHDLFLPNPKAEVIVCDGFVGNIILKLAEGAGHALSMYLSKKMSSILPEAAVKGVGQEIRGLFDATDRFGGAPLLGVKGVALVGHGRASSSVVAQAIKTAQHCVETGLVQRMQEELSKLNLQPKS